MATDSLITKIHQAKEYIENGDPLKDVMDNYDVMRTVVTLSVLLKEDKIKSEFVRILNIGGYR